MPLVVVCGIPGAGKTKRATQLAEYLKNNHHCNVVLVNEQKLGINKTQGYRNANEEKMTRGKIKFEVQKNLLGSTVVIADSLNYIKGFRYQMHCIAREQKTTYCMLYCNTSIEAAIEFNKKNQENGFEKELQEDLIKRMEAPQLKNRWDVPLFQRREEQPTPLEDIANVLLFQGKKSKDPVSTKTQEKLPEDYLYQVDKICQQICDQACLGKLKLNNTWTALQTRKVKTEFVGFVKEKPMPLKSVKETFLHFFIEADKRK